MGEVFKEAIPAVKTTQTGAAAGNGQIRMPQPAVEAPHATRWIKEMLSIDALNPDRISAATSDNATFIELSSEQHGHFRGRLRLGRVFEKTKWIRGRQLALSPTYAVACAGVTEDRRLAVTFYRTETNEMATYMSDPVILEKFWMSYDKAARQFKLNITVKEGRKSHVQLVAFSDRRYMPQPFQIEKSEDRTLALNRV